GVDLGALYRFGDNLRVGLVGRNLNSPKFGSIKERAQVRTGVAYKPLSFITLAADIDLTKNDTTVGSDFKSQNIGGGLELRFFKILMIRGGAYKNLAESDIGLVYTAGFGLNLWLINIDLGVALSKDKTDFNGDSIPEETRGEFAISMLF
ncbi:conjugal transfer protein TraF, partial [Nitrospira defluvii]|nr:conjugal transfer protein TraF [Nitrospira defluvii]